MGADAPSGDPTWVIMESLVSTGPMLTAPEDSEVSALASSEENLEVELSGEVGEAPVTLRSGALARCSRCGSANAPCFLCCVCMGSKFRRLLLLSVLPMLIPPRDFLGLELRSGLSFPVSDFRDNEVVSRWPVLAAADADDPCTLCRQLRIRSPAGSVVVLPALERVLPVLVGMLPRLACVVLRPNRAPLPPMLPVLRLCREKSDDVSQLPSRLFVNAQS